MYSSPEKFLSKGTLTKAIGHFGAVKESSMILPDGHYRHSVYYSILDTEWPQAKKRLEGMIAR